MNFQARKIRVAIFDLDNTLFDIEHRLHFLKNKDYKSFNEACIFDPFIEHTRTLLDMSASAGISPVFFSGRSEAVRQQTLQRLDFISRIQYDFYKDPDDYGLKLRKEGDTRPGHVLKLEWLKDFIKKYGDLFEIHFAVDDDPLIADMYRANGVPCLVPASRISV